MAYESKIKGNTVDRTEQTWQTLYTQTVKHTDEIASIRADIGKLEVGQESLSSQVQKGFDDIKEDLQADKKPPVNLIALASLVVIILSAFGTVLVYMNNQTAAAMKRESDLRFTSVIEQMTLTYSTINDMNARMQVDDKREQQDMYDKGVTEARIDGLSNDFYRLDDEFGIRQRRYEDVIQELKQRIGMLETRASLQ